MKIKISKDKLSINPEQFLRSAGYGFIIDRRRGQESFVRHLGSYRYPRLHMYIDRDGDIITFNLHLDQKEASYAGAHAHNAEYDGEVVGGEINRLKGLLTQYINEEKKIEAENNVDTLNKLGQGNFDEALAKTEKKSWWKKLFS